MLALKWSTLNMLKLPIVTGAALKWFQYFKPGNVNRYNLYCEIVKYAPHGWELYIPGELSYIFAQVEM